MTLDDVFSNYSDRMAQQRLYQWVAKRSSEKELERLEAYYESHKDRPRTLKNAEGFNMIFHDAENGDFRYYAQLRRSVDDQFDSVVLHKNRQYQWLLAEAYEVFEDFLEELYAFVGWLDYSLWAPTDLGKTPFKELPGKDYLWYRQRVKEKRDKPASILNQLRQAFPEIIEVERNNWFKIDLRLSICMIEVLRHVIVHCGGTVDDTAHFRQDILQKAGLWQNGEPAEPNVRFINAFLGKGKYEKHVVLLEIWSSDESKMPSYVDRLDLLGDHLMSYANYLVQRIGMHHINDRRLPPDTR